MFDISSTSGYMGAKYFQEFGPGFFTCPQLVGTWVKNIFRNLVPDFRHDSQMDLDLIFFQFVIQWDIQPRS